MKIEIEGMEQEVFRAAPQLTNTSLAVRVEIGFMYFREGRPLYQEIEAMSRNFG